MKKFLLGNAGTTLKASYIWNTIGGLLNAGQSALLLIIISRTNTVEDAGIFSIAYAIASLTITVGKFGMRNFQSTDVAEQYSFRVYMTSRIITCFGMLLVTLYYIVRGYWGLHYSIEKCLVILFLGLLKMIDAIEDVIHGKLQQKGRLDIGAKCMATRYLFILVAYAICLCVFHDLLISTVVVFALSTCYFVYTVYVIKSETGEIFHFSSINKEVILLLKDCFSLFLGGFLMIYIANAPKYAIDKYMSEQIQASFNYIFMPVYVISVLNSFIYQPILTKLAISYEKKEYNTFLKMFLRQLIFVFVLIVIVLIGGYLLGIPVLSLLYNTNLALYKQPFMILLLGGGFLAVSGYLGVVLTIMRKQNWLMIGYGITALIAFVVAEPLVLSGGVMGASILYAGLVLMQVIVFGFMFMGFRKRA